MLELSSKRVVLYLIRSEIYLLEINDIRQEEL